MSDINVDIDKKKLLKTVITRAPVAFVMMALLFFLPARTIYFWEAWVFLAILFIPAAFVLTYLYREDPELLVKRMKMKEKEKEQKFLQLFSSLFFIAMFLLLCTAQEYIPLQLVFPRLISFACGQQC